MNARARRLVGAAITALLTLACTSGEEGPPPPSPCGISGNRACPEREVCTYIDGYNEECRPITCAALADCCTSLSFVDDWAENVLPTEVSESECRGIVLEGSAQACGQELARTRTHNYCLDEPDSYGGFNSCEGEGALCDGGDFSLQYHSGSCCDGFSCEPQDDDSYVCGVCVPEGEFCSSLETNNCCDGFWCNNYEQKCVPLKADGTGCENSWECESGDCLDTGECGHDTSTGSGSGGSSGGGGDGGEPATGCDPTYCSGSQSDCTEFGCISCWYSCSGHSCQSTCSDPF